MGLSVRLPPTFLSSCSVLLVSLAVLAPASATAESTYSEYQRKGSIDACSHAPGELTAPVPNDIAQYAPDYQSALRDAARNRGNCGSPGGSKDAGTGPAGAAGQFSGKTPLGPDGQPVASGADVVAKPPAPPERSTSPPVPSAPTRLALAQAGGGGNAGTTPVPLIVLAALAALGLIGGAITALGRYFGWSPRWVEPLRHAFAEAGMRTRLAMAGAGDVLRPAPRRS